MVNKMYTDYIWQWELERLNEDWEELKKDPNCNGTCYKWIGSVIRRIAR